MLGRLRYAPVAGLSIIAAALLLTAVGPADDVGAAAPPKDLPAVEKADHNGYVEKVSDSDVSFEMVAIPGGTYLMGSPESEAGRGADEGPQHPVRVRPFWMSKTEITWDEFDIYRKEKGADNADTNDEKLAADADAITGPTPPYVDATYGHGRDMHPAICMTQHAAMEYCRWLSAKTGKKYRLPTEAEWEWAARAGTKTAYGFGDDAKDLGEYAWFIKNSPMKEGDKPTTHKVATRKPNAWGLFDMHGNVAEWCIDNYDKEIYGTFPLDKLTDGPVKIPGDRRFPHVVRGGSWSDDAPALRSAARRGSDKTWMKHDPQRPQSIWWLTKMDMIGFRIVRAVDEQDTLKGLRSKITRESRN